MCRVILVEDDTDLRNMLVDELKYEGIEVDSVGSSIELYQTLIQNQYHIALLDVGLPDQSGLEVAQYLRDKTQLGIIMLTAMGTEQDRISGYRAGADLYFVKPVDCNELAAAINNLYARLYSQTIQNNADPLEWHLNSQTWELTSPNKVTLKLTTKEIGFLEVLVNSDEDVVSRNTLLTELNYNADGHYGNKALEVMVNRLRKKIRDVTQGEAPIKTIHAVGYYFSSPIQHTF